MHKEKRFILLVELEVQELGAGVCSASGEGHLLLNSWWEKWKRGVRVLKGQARRVAFSCNRSLSSH